MATLYAGTTTITAMAVGVIRVVHCIILRVAMVETDSATRVTQVDLECSREALCPVALVLPAYSVQEEEMAVNLCRPCRLTQRLMALMIVAPVHIVVGTVVTAAGAVFEKYR